MTRQSRARLLAFATAALVVLLAALFAWLRNLSPAPVVTASPSVATDNAALAVGRAAFVRACASCHAAEGRGNPGLPLDGVGARLDRKGLRAAAYAEGEHGMPTGVARTKQSLAGDVDSDALLDYLQQLK